jgi:hypothetical protein
MSVLEPVLALVLGSLAALVHLVATRSRAATAARGGVAMAMATLPISIAGPAFCLLAAILFCPSSAWASLLGFWLLRSCALARVARY